MQAGGGLRADEIAILLPLNEGSDIRHCTRMKINYPYCFQWKEYPTCICGRRFVPTPKSNDKCLFCYSRLVL